MTRAASESATSTSATLIARVRDREPEAWSRLTQLYTPLVYGWCRKRGLHENDAADVAQEVFRAVLVHAERFHRDRLGDSFRGWLWTITRNKLHDHFRRKVAQPLAAGGTDARQRLENVPEALPLEEEDVVSGRLDSGLALRALAILQSEFEEPTWQAFWRLAVEGHPAAEIAADLGMTKGAVRQAKYRVLRRLRQEFA